MPFTVMNFLSLAGPLFLIALIAVAGYAFQTIRVLSLPISSHLAAATVILPVLNGLGAYGVSALARRSRHGHDDKRSLVTVPALLIGILIIIYETAVATLALTHMAPPSSLNCGLDERWLHLFRSKNGNAIRRIQDAYQCCGLHSTHDKAFPFPSKSVGIDACAKTFGRQKSCFGDWRQDEQIMAGLLLLVTVLVFLSKIGVLFLLRTRSTWIHKLLHRPWTHSRQYQAITASEDANTGRQRTMDQYPDQPLDRADEEAGGAGIRRAIADRNGDADGDSGHSGPRVQPSGLLDGENQWGSEQAGEQ